MSPRRCLIDCAIDTMIADDVDTLMSRRQRPAFTRSLARGFTMLLPRLRDTYFLAFFFFFFFCLCLLHPPLFSFFITR